MILNQVSPAEHVPPLAMTPTPSTMFFPRDPSNPVQDVHRSASTVAHAGSFLQQSVLHDSLQPVAASAATAEGKNLLPSTPLPEPSVHRCDTLRRLSGTSGKDTPPPKKIKIVRFSVWFRCFSSSLLKHDR